jgi:Zn-dependent protease with chaperone function
MSPALLVFGYAVAVAWGTPALLTRLTSAGLSARLGLAAWLTAMTSALASLAVAMTYLVSAAITGWSQLAEAVCRSVAGGACTAVVYRSAVFELGLGLATIAATLALAVLAWRYGRSVQRAQRRTRAHAEAALITGRRLPENGAPLTADPAAAGTVAVRTAAARTAAARTGAARTPAVRTALVDTVVVDAARPAAYCVPGRPAAIVLTSGALAVLDPGQLNAVLAHERAHLAGRHHLLIALTRGLAATFPAVPLFTRGPAEVARLAEMCADDAAARRSNRPTLVAALLAMGTGSAVPAAALAATTCAVTARVQRLLEPAPPARHARNRLALVTVILLLALASGLVTRFAGPLTAHALLVG